MKVAIMQPYFFPYLGYFQAMHAVDKYILHDQLNYIKEGFIHRNRYLTTGGDVKFFNVAVQKKSSNALIADIRVADHVGWRGKIKEQFKQNYRRAPFFEDVFPLVEKVVDADTDLLAEINAKSIAMVKGYLGLSCDLVPNAENYLDIEDNLRAIYVKGVEGRAVVEKKTMRVLMVCQRENADIFVNATGGRDLYRPDQFRAYGVDLYFVQSDLIKYPQYGMKYFQPNLSILDALFNCSPEHVVDMVGRYQLIQ